jgi:3-hydroxyacyl-CoA dehydrogenase
VPWLRRNLERIGKVPVALAREIDGFILNRLQWALVNEAWALFDEGFASAADIDATVSQGLGLRWAFMGPFETIDLNAPGGVADYAGRFGGNIHQIMSERGTPKAWTRELVDRVTAERRAVLPLDDLAGRSAWRDRRLMALTAHLAEQRRQDDQF